MTQTAVPTSDVGDAGAVRWTKVGEATFYETVDDYFGGGSPDDDTTYIRHLGDGTLASYVDLGLSALSDPLIYGLHVLTVYMKLSQAGSFTVPARVEIRDASANVFAAFNLAPTTTYAAYTFTLDVTQAQAISSATAYGALIVRVVAPGQGDGATQLRVSAIKFDVPDVAPTIGALGFFGALFLGRLLETVNSYVGAGAMGLIGMAGMEPLAQAPFGSFSALGLLGRVYAQSVLDITPDPQGPGCEGQLLRGGSEEGELRHGESAQGETLRGGSEEGQLTRC